MERICKRHHVALRQGVLHIPLPPQTTVTTLLPAKTINRRRLDGAARRDLTRQRQLERWTTIRERHAKGASLKDLARGLRLNYKTVRKYARATECPHMKPYPQLELKYNKFYIGLANNRQPNNFAIFRPRKNDLNLEVRLKTLDDITQELEQVGLDVMDYDKKWSRYRIRLTKADIKNHEEFLTKFLKRAYNTADSYGLGIITLIP